MVGMTTFDESQHPRGQAANAGQFASKSNDAPAGELAATLPTLADALDQLRAALALHEQGAAEFKTDITDDPLIGEVRAVLAAAAAEKARFAVPAEITDAIARDFPADEPMVFIPAGGTTASSSTCSPTTVRKAAP